MPFSLRPGQVFRPKAIRAHVHVVISQPSGSAGPVLVVNWTTLDADCIDDACILNPGDHPAISHPSAMAYSRAHVWQAEKIIVAVANGLFRRTGTAGTRRVKSNCNRRNPVPGIASRVEDDVAETVVSFDRFI